VLEVHFKSGARKMGTVGIQKKNRSIVLGALFATLQIVSLSQASAQSLVTDELNFLDKPSVFRDSYVKDENARVNKYLAASANYQPLLKFIFMVDDRAQESQVALLPDGSSIILRDGGLMRPQKLFLKTATEDKQIFNVLDLKLGPQVTIIDTQLSPNKRWLALVLSVNGAITDYDLVVFDIQNRKVSQAFPTNKFFASVQWLAEDVLAGPLIGDFNKAPDYLLVNVAQGASQVFTLDELKALANGATQSTSDTVVVNKPEVLIGLNPRIPELASQAAAATGNVAGDEADKKIRALLADITQDVLLVKSEDGTEVPMVMYRLKSTTANGRRPVLMESYGGFGVNFGTTSTPDQLQTVFILQGGIVVKTALRGGSERGDSWYLAAAGAKNKIKTYQDLIACAKGLVTLGWTNPKMIASTGTSNGGLTVAAAALLSPGTFGLVIPIAGVVDLVSYDKHDPAFAGQWSHDYGNPQDIADLSELARISPVELAKNQGATNFLVMAGTTDDRVNVTNSIKLAAALHANGSPDLAYLSITKNAGHALVDADVGDHKGWMSSTIFWTYVYDKFNMKFSWPPQ
jgi:dienelactone hydrolase